ncbi:hypothetical protein WEU38_02370 [Cyanobacterium aponinum AL20118]|uniref:Uncharacterized protein n=1 Tax=Cyanobacterium aponinum AL20115 TaxID=3090662 RepID=A0AAF0Z9Z4_9CHRO|nr:hypothetical protein [Cyanobacterium aponinum]WPF89146.1 hypothetical protein SAY89_02385 [Cyanobacterium aponinum AL20115]
MKSGIPGVQTPTQPWWNRPLLGNQSLLQWLKTVLSFQSKQEIPESTIQLYTNSFGQLKNIAAIARTIDKEKFTSKEFINFLMLNRQFESNAGAYEGLRNSIELLRVALETKESFLKIEATETRYRSFSQQEFYDYVYNLLVKDMEVAQFQEAIQKQLVRVIPKIKSDEGKAAIQSYVNHLETVCKDKLGLKLLYLFKQYDMSNFSLLRTVGEIADSFYDKDLDSLKEFMVVVQVNADIFLKLGQIIQVPQKKNVPETYAITLQYIALRNRHQNSFAQFQQLLGLLRQWENFYNPIIAIAKEYPPSEYKQPDIFKADIPGLEIYNKYQTHL